MSLPLPSSVSTTLPSSIFPLPSTVTTTNAQPSSGSGGGGGGGGGGGSSLANSASLYLYTFLATLVLLLSVSSAIVIRSFILRRRHRQMVEEAIRNGTWIPSPQPTRPPRVDLSKKPTLWEAYLGDDAWHLRDLGQGNVKELGIGTHRKSEHSKDWESIKPVCLDYAVSASSVPDLSSPAPIPVPSPVTPPALRGDEENQQVSSNPSFFTRARIFLNPPPPSLTSALPASSTTDNPTNAHPNPTNMSMIDFGSSPPMKVAVLIAMPSPPLSSSHGSSPAVSASFSSSLSSGSNVPQRTTSHPLQTSPSHTLDATTSAGSALSGSTQKYPLPHLEMGVAEVVIGPPEDSTSWDNAHSGGQRKSTYSQGSSYIEP